MIEEGASFPEFSLLDQDDQTVTWAGLAGKPFVVYFYPKDDTPGCTVEACEFRDAVRSLSNVKVVGVSPDDSKSHRKFIAKFNLNFSLLADTKHALCEAAGVWGEKSMYGKKYMGVFRTTFVVDSQGKVAKVFPNVKPHGHAAEVQAFLDRMGR